jgi:hypothetical protein
MAFAMVAGPQIISATMFATREKARANSFAYVSGTVEFIVYVAASLVALWGVAHAIPTAQVVPGFAPITVDNRRVLTQEWLAEAFTMWGVSPPSSWWRRHSGGRDRM